MRILVAEDDAVLAEGVMTSLRHTGHAVDWVKNGEEADSALDANPFDLLILDLGLPRKSGLEVLKRLRARESRVPVLILTARDSLMERVSTLHEGADDFLAKPFELEELEARLVALIRRSRGREQPRFACGPLSYDAASKLFLLEGEQLQLSPREHAVLRVLIQHSGEPLSKQEILERLFSDEQDARPEMVEVLVHRLRRRLEHGKVKVTTLRGLGYVLEAAP
jgi:two-component system response regulator TctD